MSSITLGTVAAAKGIDDPDFKALLALQQSDEKMLGQDHRAGACLRNRGAVPRCGCPLRGGWLTTPRTA